MIAATGIWVKWISVDARAGSPDKAAGAAAGTGADGSVATEASASARGRFSAFAGGAFWASWLRKADCFMAGSR